MAPKALEAPVSSPSNRKTRNNHSILLSNSSKRTTRATSVGRGREPRCVSGLQQLTNTTKNRTISNVLLPNPRFYQAKSSMPRLLKEAYSSPTEASVGWSSNRSRSNNSYCQSQKNHPLRSSDHRHLLRSYLIRTTSSSSQELQEAQAMKK